jgi:CelD/BcsL family acetyltransferase involved in cellulose biosynthesis
MVDELADSQSCLGDMSLRGTPPRLQVGAIESSSRETAEPRDGDPGKPKLSKQNVGARPPASCELALITQRAEFEALEAEWNALFERAGRPSHVFQNFNWLWHWANHYLGERVGLSIIVGRRQGRLAMVCPFVSTRRASIRRLSWMGEPVSQYGDVLLESDDKELLYQGWAYARSLGVDVLDLRKIRSDANIYPLLANSKAIRTIRSQAPYLDLASAADFASYSQRYPAKKRSDRRRHWRRLNELGLVSFEQHMAGYDARDLADRAIALKQAWLASRGTIFPSIYDPRFIRFYRDIALDAVRWPGTRISALHCNARSVGVEISLECKKQIFGAIISYDLEYAKQGAGVVLAECCIRAAHKRGFQRYDLLSPADPYKLDWADGAIDVADWAMPLTHAGSLYARAWLCFARPFVKRTAPHWPDWLRQTAAILQS